MQIIVLGTHRSGTSLVTRLINMMGAYFASEHASIGFNDENPKGFWERKDVIECDDELLALQGCRWDEVAEWRPGESPEIEPELETRLKNIVLDLDAHRPWVVKDPRMCLTFESWRSYLEVPVALVMYRDPLEVAKSLHTRNGVSLHEGLALWEYYTVGALAASANISRVLVSHADFMTDPVKATKTMYDGLIAQGVRGLRLPSDQEIIAFVEPKYYRSKVTLDHAQFLNPHQLALMGYAQGKTLSAPLSVSEAAREALLLYAERKRRERIAEDERTLLAETQRLFAKKEQEIARLQERHQRYVNEAETLKVKYHNLLHEVESIKMSTSWKLGNGVVRLAQKVVGK